MEYIRLGLTDTHISRIGFGCAAMGGYDYGVVDDRDSEMAVRKALELGVNFFDTADVYGLGHAEEVLGKALGRHRHNVVIATKVGVRWDEDGKTQKDLSPKTVVRALEGSLKRLNLECIPLYQLHWPDPQTPIEATLEVLEKCQKEGKVKHIGCCNFPFELVEQVQRFTRLESVQVPYSLAENTSQHLIGVCRERYSVSVFCYNVLAHGLLSGKYNKHSEFQGTDLRKRAVHFQGPNLERNLEILDRLKTVAQKLGKTPAQVAIRWVLEDDAVDCALIGVKTPQQIQDNHDAMGWQLSREDHAFLLG